jgi:hypothetical protein
MIHAPIPFRRTSGIVATAYIPATPPAMKNCIPYHKTLSAHIPTCLAPIHLKKHLS